MKKRDRYQKRAAALRRMSLAIDRVIARHDPNAKRWARAWARAAVVSPSKTPIDREAAP
jgi:hypothetical protein